MTRYEHRQTGIAGLGLPDWDCRTGIAGPGLAGPGLAERGWRTGVGGPGLPQAAASRLFQLPALPTNVVPAAIPPDGY